MTRDDAAHRLAEWMAFAVGLSVGAVGAVAFFGWVWWNNRRAWETT